MHKLLRGKSYSVVESNIIEFQLLKYGVSSSPNNLLSIMYQEGWRHM